MYSNRVYKNSNDPDSGKIHVLQNEFDLLVFINGSTDNGYELMTHVLIS